MADPCSDRFVRNHVKMRQLVLLVELGRHGTILHAAQAVHLTQPAASKLLSEMENALGAKLFERLPRGVVPTAHGAVMIRRAAAALAELEAGHQEVMELLSGLAGRVAVGSVLTPSTTLLPAAVVALKSQQPRVHVAITIGTSKLLVQQLQAGELDFYIGRVLDGASAAQLSFEPLEDEPHSVIARAGHPMAGTAGLGLKDLSRQAWILPPAGSILRDRLTALFICAGLDPPQQAVETLSMPVVTQLLSQSDMVVALPPALVRPYLDAGLLTVLDVALGLRMDDYGIVTRRGHQLSPGATLLLDLLREQVQRHGAGHAVTARPQ